MMKHNTTFLKRCLALALALVLVVSGSNLGWALRAFAVEGDDVSVNVGTVVAGNYDLTDAEKALLSSGLLVGGTITVDALSGDKVTVDSEAKTITAKKDGEWVPVSATIKVGEEVKETIPLTAGEAAAYTYEGKAFSVEVTYEVYGDVNANDQATLLQAPAYLKTGVDNLGTIASNAGSLALYYMFNDALVMLADGIEYSYGFMNVNIQFESEEAVAAAKALAGQIDTANGDNNLDLQDMANAHNSTVAAKYLVENGAAMKAPVWRAVPWRMPLVFLRNARAHWAWSAVRCWTSKAKRVC